MKIGISSSTQEIISDIKREVVENLPLNPSDIDYQNAEHYFDVNLKGSDYELLKNNFKLSLSPDKVHTFKYLQNEIRQTIAEFAVSKVFLHAGAVGINGFGVIFPAETFQGKSTLITELVKAGATYYSDDFAILDENAWLHPFPKRISLRGFENKFAQTDFSVEQFGGEVGIEPIEIKLVVLTKYEKDSGWSPEILSPGNAVMNILPHTVPIRFNPQFTLQVLHKLTNRAIIARSSRCDAKEFAPILLKFIKRLNF